MSRAQLPRVLPVRKRAAELEVGDLLTRHGFISGTVTHLAFSPGGVIVTTDAVGTFLEHLGFGDEQEVTVLVAL